MKSVLFALMSALLFVQAHAAGPEKKGAEMPTTWAAFQASKALEDVRAVADVEKMKWWERCTAWGRDVRAKSQTRKAVAVRENLLDGKYLTSVDLMAVTGKKPEIGQSACGVFAVLGSPSKINQTQTSTRMSAQLVYRDRGIYVYTEGSDANGTVRSIQF